MQAQLSAQLSRQLHADSGLSLADYEILVQLSGEPDDRVRPLSYSASCSGNSAGSLTTSSGCSAGALVEREECSEDACGTGIVRHRRRPAGHRRGAAPAHVDTVRCLIFGTLSCDQVVALEQVSNEVLDQVGAVGGPGC
jgi:hypothetical protein